jgi:hypothetical protein
VDDLEELRMAILNEYSDLNATELPTSLSFLAGSDAIQRGIDGVCPDNDVIYLWSANQSVSQQTPPFFDLSQYYPFLRYSAVTLGNDANDFAVSGVLWQERLRAGFAPMVQLQW